ncbi:unnamed protein product [Sphenostylis stenocarpa]|uniref:Uncharacterized protein n=1 Tax=Sphenostylis stenocarpa TaxID=92480 RepID=A0AA86VR25_9FABA|nr:unnamed protein product [Sphenostylis stenocarpa]
MRENIMGVQEAIDFPNIVQSQGPKGHRGLQSITIALLHLESGELFLHPTTFNSALALKLLF